MDILHSTYPLMLHRCIKNSNPPQNTSLIFCISLMNAMMRWHFYYTSIKKHTTRGTIRLTIQSNQATVTKGQSVEKAHCDYTEEEFFQ